MKQYDNIDEFWMFHALMLAKYAELEGEIPVGAVLVLNDKIISEGWNNSINLNDPTAHAEIMALREGGKKIKNYRLLNTTLYVTLAPCMMCIGAIINARINRLVFGSLNINNSKYIINRFYNTKNNSSIRLTAGILKKKCSEQIKNFFKKKRQNHIFKINKI